jgi:Flp pilus assembly protein TadG
VFFLLVAGMFDFGLGIYSDLTLVNAAREGARIGVIDPGNTSAIEDRVRAMAGNLDSDKLTVDVACERPSGSAFTSCTSPMWLPGDATRVTVDYRYSMFFPILFGTEIPLSSEATMRIE